MIRRPSRSTRTATLFPYTTLFRSEGNRRSILRPRNGSARQHFNGWPHRMVQCRIRRSTRLLHPMRHHAFFGTAKREYYRPHDGQRAEERRVGKKCGSTCRSRRSPVHSKKKENARNKNYKKKQ